MKLTRLISPWLCLIPALLFAQDSISWDLVSQSLHRWDYLQWMERSEDLLAAITNSNQITLFDLSQPDTLTEQSVFVSEGLPSLLDDGLLFLAGNDTLVAIYDVSQPVSPLLVGTIPPSQEETDGIDVERVGDILYVAEIGYPPYEERSGIRYYDISDLNNIIHLGFIQRDHCLKLMRAGNLLMIEGDSLALDISVPSSPTAVQLDLHPPFVANDSLVVTWSLDSIFVHTIQQETFDLIPAGSCAKPNDWDSHRVAELRNSILVLSDVAWDLAFYDLSDPTAPTYRSTYSSGRRPREAILTEGECITVEGSKVLSRLETTNLDQINERFSTTRRGFYSSLLPVDDIIYAVTEGNGIAAIDVSDPAQPLDLFFELSDQIIESPLIHKNGQLIVNSWDMIPRPTSYTVLPDYSLSDPQEIQGLFPVSPAMVVDEDTLYCVSNSLVYAYQLGVNGAIPLIRYASYSILPSYPRSAAILGDIMIVSVPGEGIYSLAFREEHPGAMELRLPLEDDYTMLVDGATMYICTDEHLTSYSLAGDGTLQELDVLSVGIYSPPARMILNQGYLYIPHPNGGATIISCANPANLQYITYIRTPFYIRDLVFDGNLVISAEGSWLRVYNQTIISNIQEVRAEVVPTEFQLASTYPNPFNPTLHLVVAVPHAAALKAEVYDLLGRRVATLSNEHTFQPGYHALSWTPQGSSGVYFIRLEAGNEWQAMRKVVFVK